MIKRVKPFFRTTLYKIALITITKINPDIAKAHKYNVTVLKKKPKLSLCSFMPKILAMMFVLVKNKQMYEEGRFLRSSHQSGRK